MQITFIKEAIHPTVTVNPLPAATQQAFPRQGQGHWQSCPGQTHWNVLFTQGLAICILYAMSLHSKGQDRRATFLLNRLGKKNQS